MTKERQMGKTLDDIRDDHKARYREAAAEIAKSKGNICTVLDIGCGVGYGSYIMATMFKKSMVWIDAVDRSLKAIDHAESFYYHDRINYVVGDFENFNLNTAYDMATAFEIIEHSTKSADYLFERSKNTRYLIGSVPNQEVVPFDKNLHHYHVRHYDPVELEELLNENGWRMIRIGGQRRKHGIAAGIEWGTTAMARTLVFFAQSMALEKQKQ